MVAGINLLSLPRLKLIASPSHQEPRAELFLALLRGFPGSSLLKVTGAPSAVSRPQTGYPLGHRCSSHTAKEGCSKSPYLTLLVEGGEIPILTGQGEGRFL